MSSIFKLLQFGVPVKSNFQNTMCITWIKICAIHACQQFNELLVTTIYNSSRHYDKCSNLKNVKLAYNSRVIIMSSSLEVYIRDAFPRILI